MKLLNISVLLKLHVDGKYISGKDFLNHLVFWLLNGTKDFLPIIKNTIGSSWDGLSNNAKAATLSITYNYGRVPNRKREALKSGDNNEIAKAIRSLSTDNKGVNKKRRHTEAELVLLPDTSQTSLVQRRTK